METDINLPLLTMVTAAAIYAGYRAFQGAWTMLRDSLLHLSARRALGALQDEVDQGRRTSFELFLQHGLHHLKLRDPHRARAFFEAASAAHPLSPHGHYGLGLAHRESMYFPGRLQEEALQKAIERDATHEGARRLLLEFYLDVGLYERARETLRNLPDCEDLRPMVERAEPLSLHDAPLTWTRMSAAERLMLLGLDLVLAIVGVTAIFQPDLRPAACALLLVVPLHALLFRRLEADGEGFAFRSLSRTLRYRWNDLLDLVEVPDRGFLLHVKDRSLFVSRGWTRYADVIRCIKHHLYGCGWVPGLKQY